MNYKHTQKGYLMYYVILFVIILFGVILLQMEFELLMLLFMIFVIVVLFSFSSLTASVNSNELLIKFGYGIYKKRFLISEIASVKEVRNHWYYGWGIRVWWWPFMIIYNVSGFKAIEIRLKNNHIYRIGTDEPKELEKAIRKKIN